MHDQALLQRIDTAVHVTGLLVRAGVYALIGAIAHGPCWQSILTGLFVGDAVASFVALFWRPRQTPAQALAELGVLALVWLWIGDDLLWPHEPPLRALLALAALGVLSSRVGAGASRSLAPGGGGLGR